MRIGTVPENTVDGTTPTCATNTQLARPRAAPSRGHHGDARETPATADIRRLGLAVRIALFFDINRLNPL